MEIKNTRIESFLKGLAFSLLLCLLCSYHAFKRVRLILVNFDLFELSHLFFNITLALLFLIRHKASVVSMNLVHWVVALATSYSGFFFIKDDANPDGGLARLGDILMVCAFFLEITAALALGRSFGFLPALRRVKTDCIYKIVRHPMYLGCLIVRLAYCLKNPLPLNVFLLGAVAILYAKRAEYEERILLHDDVYAEYARRVKYQFVPGIY